MSEQSRFPSWGRDRAIDLFYIKGRLGWKGLKASEFRNEGPFLITGTDFEGGKVEWNRSVHISNDRFIESPEIVVQAGDILITKDGTVGKVAFIDKIPPPGQASLNSHLFLVRSGTGKVDGRFAFYVFESDLFGHFVSVKQTGSTRIGLPQRVFEQFDFPVPPRCEQKGIADLLCALDDGIVQTEALIAKYQQIKAGLMHDLFTRGVTPDGHLRPSSATSPHLYKKSVHGYIPSEWEVGGIGNYLIQFGGMKPGPFGSSLTKDSYSETGYRVYGQEQVLAGSLSEGDYRIPAAKWTLLSDFAIADGDILMTLVGVGTIGQVLLVKKPFEPGIINPRIMRLRPSRVYCRADFLRLLIASPTVRNQFNRFATGGTMPVLNATIVRRVRVPIVPLDEQDRIASILQSIDGQLASERGWRDKLLSQKYGLAHDLLTGRVRVNVEATAN